MSKVLLEINYEVQASKRDEYLKLIKELKSGYESSGLAKLEVYEVQGSQNSFVEIYTYKDEEAFKNADDSAFDEIVVKINDCLIPDKIGSHTLHQI